MLLEHWLNDIEYHLSCLVLAAVLLAILLAAARQLEARSLELLLEATTPEGTGVSINRIVSGPADAVEGDNILVGLEEDSNSLVELYARSVSMFLRLAVLLLLVDGGWSCRTRRRARGTGCLPRWEARQSSSKPC